jgi:epoxyqueuosine reductase
MLTSQDIKKFAKKCGADIVGIGDINLFDGVKKEQDPRQVFPETKAIIGLGFRVLRGTFRGIEEGTQYYQYPEMGVVNIDEIYAPIVLANISRYIEDNGYESVVQRSIPDRRHHSDKGTNPERLPVFKIPYSKPVYHGKAAPDVIIDFNLAAYICGLGEIGFGGFFLTPEFGPFQRFAFILTDAPLAPDPVYSSKQLCDKCMKCIEACPGKAINSERVKSVSVEGRTNEFAELNEWQCSAYYCGANKSTNPFMPKEALGNIDDRQKVLNGDKELSENEASTVISELCNYYPEVRFGYTASICGKACWRACYSHLEEKGLIIKKLNSKFRNK